MTRIRISPCNPLKKVCFLTKDIHQIWCRSTKFLSKWNFYSRPGSGSWFHFGFQYETYISCIEDTHQIWCRSAKFVWKSKFCSRSGSGSGSWFYCGFQSQTYISYIEDTHQILFRSANSFESYCVHMKSSRTYAQTNRRTDRRNCFLLLLCFNIYKTWTFIKRRGKLWPKAPAKGCFWSNVKKNSSILYTYKFI